jgi:hypothetical protein
MSMALTINPAVSGGRRRWVSHSAVFGGGVFVGAFFVLLGSLATLTVLQGFALASIAWVALRDVGLRVPVPYRSSQVPEHFREQLPPSIVAAAFGTMLGTGLLTRFTYSLHFAVLVAIGLIGSTSLIVYAAIALAVGKSVVLLVAASTTKPSDILPRFRTGRLEHRLLRAMLGLASISIAILLIAGN